MPKQFLIRIVTLAFVLVCSNSLAAETFRVATYNVENYLDQPTESRLHIKSAEAKAKIRESIKAMNLDVIALDEMGTTNSLLELRAALKVDGLDFPFREHIESFDTNIHIAILSKLPIVARRPHTNEFFLLDGRRFQVKRGFAEVDIRAATNFTFTLVAAHLKSRLTTPEANEAEERLARPRCYAESLINVSRQTRTRSWSFSAISMTRKIPIRSRKSSGAESPSSPTYDPPSATATTRLPGRRNSSRAMWGRLFFTGKETNTAELTIF